MLNEEVQNLKELLVHLEAKNTEMYRQFESSKKTLQDFERNYARSDEIAGLSQTNVIFKSKNEELEKRVFTLEIE